jgi:hypothetical protein
VCWCKRALSLVERLDSASWLGTLLTDPSHTLWCSEGGTGNGVGCDVAGVPPPMWSANEALVGLAHCSQTDLSQTS